MKMESGAEAQQGAETTETESQQITPAQIATLAQVRPPFVKRTILKAKHHLCMNAERHGHVTPEFQVSMAAGHGAGPTVTLVQLPNGQTVQVHGVIQAAQPSVIQSPHVQAVQVNADTYNPSFRPLA